MGAGATITTPSCPLGHPRRRQSGAADPGNRPGQVPGRHRHTCGGVRDRWPADAPEWRELFRFGFSSFDTVVSHCCVMLMSPTPKAVMHESRLCFAPRFRRFEQTPPLWKGSCPIGNFFGWREFPIRALILPRRSLSMSMTQTLAPHLPYLRRYARALTGSQATGDAHVRAALHGPFGRGRKPDRRGSAPGRPVPAVPRHLAVAGPSIMTTADRGGKSPENRLKALSASKRAALLLDRGRGLQPGRSRLHHRREPRGSRKAPSWTRRRPSTASSPAGS